jgi:hypothetical protein
MARWATMTMMIAMGEDDDNDNGEGMTGDEVDNAGNSAMGDGTTGYGDVDDCDGRRRQV